jgi:hypothetical protein
MNSRIKNTESSTRLIPTVGAGERDSWFHETSQAPWKSKELRLAGGIAVEVVTLL